MCGINGFNFKDEELILKMNQLTQHRGPDGTGVFVDDKVTLGHNLLAIVETPANSSQPIVSEDGNYALSYNGEIYNYLELRSELEESGDKFNTNSDTEVLLKGLIRQGDSFISKLNGMFAFALFNKRANKLLLARDSAGMKPLYYYHNRNEFIFSSELRAILSSKEAVLNVSAAKVFFSLGYVPGPDTLFLHIYKVNPGECMILDLQTSMLEKKWFHVSSKEFKKFSPEETRKVVSDSVKQHTMGLRPFGLYLSGGLDSTVILHELSKIEKGLIKTYTTRFDTKDPALNEDANVAKKLCDEYKIDYHELLVTEADFIDAIPKTIRTLEEPRYNFSVPAYWLLAQHASKDVTVILNGSGGDELFLGYDRYLQSRASSYHLKNKSIFWVNFRSTISSWLKGKLRPPHFLRLDKALDRWVNLNDISPLLSTKLFRKFNSYDQKDLLKYIASISRPEIKKPVLDMENTQGDLDRIFWLGDEEFLRTDKIAMNFGMEGRFPFLSREVIDYSHQISSSDKLVGGVTKAVIRDAYRGQLPDYVIDKEKTGWYAPVVEWMDSKLGDFVRDVLSPDFYPETAQLFDLDFIRKEYVRKDMKFTRGNIKKFLPIFNFQIWAKEFNVKLP